MSKPWEKKWVLESPGVVRVDDAMTLTVHVAPWRMGREPGRDEWAAASEYADTMTAFVRAAPVMARALLPLARFVAAFDAKPIRGIDDALYGIHGGDGSPGGADVRMSDLRKAVDALRKAGVLP